MWSYFLFKSFNLKIWYINLLTIILLQQSLLFAFFFWLFNFLNFLLFLILNLYFFLFFFPFCLFFFIHLWSMINRLTPWLLLLINLNLSSLPFLIGFLGLLQFLNLLFVLKMVLVVIIKLFLLKVSLFIEKSLGKGVVLSFDSFGFAFSITYIQTLRTRNVGSRYLIFLDWGPFTSWNLY